MGIRTKYVNLLLAGASLVAPVGSALAQDDRGAASSPVAAEEEYGDNIVVTARRREERLQDVPLAVSAVTSDVLQRNNIQNVLQLSRVVPSLTTMPGGTAGRAYPQFAIRGQTQQELTILADPSVSTYIGDIVAARAHGLNSAVYDLGSVEVLRGPQGTLFGRNTTGGAIILRPNRPTDRLEGRVGVTVGRFSTFNTEGMINIPVSDAIMVRLAGITLKDDGFVYDEILGRKVDKTKQQAGRASVLLRSPGGIESLTVYNYFHSDEGGTPTFIKFANPNGAFNSAGAQAGLNYRPFPTLLAEQQARGMYRIANGTPIFTRIETHDVANTTTIPLTDAISIKNIIGYRHIKSHSYDEWDGTSNSTFPVERADRYSQFSNEFQILGDMPRLKWIAGAYYFWESGNGTGESAVGARDLGLIEPANIDGYVNAYANTWVAGHNRSYAFFAQGTYDLGAMAEGLSITAGARFNHDDRFAIIRNRTRTACRFSLDLDNNPATPEVVPPLSGCEFRASKSYEKPTYNLSLEYKVSPDALVYLAHRHGYRTGGFGARAGTEAGLRRTFRPEIVDDIELGMKADWHIGGTFLRTNLAGYYASYKDIQRLLQDNSTLPVTTVAVNGQKARVYGIEADVLFRPIQALELTANYAYTNAKFKKFVLADGTDLTNRPFTRTPRNVYTLGARVYVPVPEDVGEITVGTSLYHTDKFAGTDGANPVTGFTPAYSLVNLDANWNRVLGSDFDLGFFMTNVAGKKYSLWGGDYMNLGFAPYIAGRPRTWGLTARYHFGN